MDGKLVDSDARTGNDDLTDSVVSRIGNDAGGGTNPYWSGLIYFVYIYNRALSPSEIQSLYEAPYQIIQPIRRRFYFPISEEAPVAAGGIMTTRTNFWGDL